MFSIKAFIYTRDFARATPGVRKNINVFNIYNAQLHPLLLKYKPNIELEMSKTEKLSFLQSKNTYEKI